MSIAIRVIEHFLCVMYQTLMRRNVSGKYASESVPHRRAYGVPCEKSAILLPLGFLIGGFRTNFPVRGCLNTLPFPKSITCVFAIRLAGSVPRPAHHVSRSLAPKFHADRRTICRIIRDARAQPKYMPPVRGEDLVSFLAPIPLSLRGIPGISWRPGRPYSDPACGGRCGRYRPRLARPACRRSRNRR